MVYAIPDQKTDTIACVFVDEIVPFYGVPQCLLSDRGTNLLSHLMRDLCLILGIKKLNTTACHPECDSMVERFNCSSSQFYANTQPILGSNGTDTYLEYCTPTGTQQHGREALFGIDLRSPTEAAYLPPSELNWTTPEDHQEEAVMTMSSARSLAAASIEEAQKRYKRYYDCKAKQQRFKIGDKVFVRFPGEEQGKQCKLSRPWHGPYWITSRDDPDVSVVKSYFPGEGGIRIHQKTVYHGPPGFPLAHVNTKKNYTWVVKWYLPLMG